MSTVVTLYTSSNLGGTAHTFTESDLDTLFLFSDYGISVDSFMSFNCANGYAIEYDNNVVRGYLNNTLNSLNNNVYVPSDEFYIRKVAASLRDSANVLWFSISTAQIGVASITLDDIAGGPGSILSPPDILVEPGYQLIDSVNLATYVAGSTYENVSFASSPEFQVSVVAAPSSYKRSYLNLWNTLGTKRFQIQQESSQATFSLPGTNLGMNDGVQSVLDTISLLLRVEPAHSAIDSVVTRVSTVESDIGSLSSRSGELEGDIDSVVERVSSVESGVESLSGRSSDLEHDIDSVVERVSSVESGVESLSGRSSDLEHDIDSVVTRVSSVESGIGSLSERSSDLEHDIDSVVERVSSVESGIESLSGRSSDLEHDIDSVVTRVSSVESGIESLSGRSSDLEHDIDSVVTRVSSVESGVESLSGRSSDLEHDIDSVVTRVSSVESGIGSLSERSSDLEHDIDSVVTRVSSVESGVESLSGRSSDLEHDIDSVVTRVSSVETDIDSLSTRVSGSESELDSVIERVSNVESDVSDVQNVIKVIFDGDSANGNYDTLQLITAELLANPDDYNVEAIESRLSYLEDVINELTLAP